MWKFRIMHALKAAYQYDHVTRMVNTEGADYENKKQKTFYLVLQCISQKYIPMVMNCQMAKEVWDVLCHFFERKTISNKVSTVTKCARELFNPHYSSFSMSRP